MIKTHKQLVEAGMKLPGVQAAYNKLEKEFDLLKKTLKVRNSSGKKQ